VCVCILSNLIFVVGQHWVLKSQW